MMVDQANKLRDMFSSKQESDHSKELSSRVITITSGKGGVGKTNFAVNFAIELRKQNKRVVMLDADLGLSNIEVLFGIIPSFSFAEIINGTKAVQEVITDGPMGIKFISGGSGLKEVLNITDKQLDKVLDSLEYLDTISDVIIIDTGAGISNSVTNFIQASSETIILTTPEPTAITDAYSLIKTTKAISNELPVLKVVINRVESEAEGKEVFQKLSKVSEKFLDVKLESLGFIPADPLLVKAVKRQQPVSICYPNSEFTEAMKNITLKVLDIQTPSDYSKTGIKSFMKRLVNIFNS